MFTFCNPTSILNENDCHFSLGEMKWNRILLILLHCSCYPAIPTTFDADSQSATRSSHTFFKTSDFFPSDIKQNLELLLLSFCLISSRCQFSGNLEVVRWFRLSIPNQFLPHQQQIHLLASTLIRLQLLHLNRPRQEIIPPQFVARSIILKALGQIYANDFILNLIHR